MLISVQDKADCLRLCYTILRALKIKKIGRILDERHLSLTRAALHNTSKSRTLYLHIMHKCQYQHKNKHCNLTKQICNSKGIILLKCLFDELYARSIVCPEVEKTKIDNFLLFNIWGIHLVENTLNYHKKTNIAIIFNTF